ncbi:MAG: cytochrome P450, partial [Marmoricola sp.]
ATAPVTVGDVLVEPGQRIAALLGSANRDPAVFRHPDSFDVGRDPNPHLAFGVGVHFCLGAPLARMELAESLAALIRDLADHRRSQPADDLVTDLVATDLSPDEVVASAVLLLNAGHEASVNVFGNGLVGLLERELRPAEDVALTVEEMLRFDSALQLFERTATEVVEVGGVALAAGEKIAVLLGSANRDPVVFDAPGEFRVDRTPNNHVAFGVGVHFCLGAPLARMELFESVSHLFNTYPSLALAGEPESRGTFVLRGYHRVEVSVR